MEEEGEGKVEWKGRGGLSGGGGGVEGEREWKGRRGVSGGGGEG